MKRTCIQCGKEFELSNSEIGFYKKRKLSLPKRCKECRELNKKSGAVQKKGGTAQKTVSGDVTEKKPDTRQAASAASVKSSSTSSKDTSVKKSGGFSLKKTLAAVGLLAIVGIYSAVSGTLPFGADEPAATGSQGSSQNEDIDYSFRTEELFESHYEKHGIEMGFDSAKAYLEAANDVIDSPDVLHKTEAEDGDGVYFLEDTNEFVVLSTDGYIRTYYIADGGMEYYERQ